MKSFALRLRGKPRHAHAKVPKSDDAAISPEGSVLSWGTASFQTADQPEFDTSEELQRPEQSPHSRSNHNVDEVNNASFRSVMSSDSALASPVYTLRTLLRKPEPVPELSPLPAPELSALHMMELEQFERDLLEATHSPTIGGADYQHVDVSSVSDTHLDDNSDTEYEEEEGMEDGVVASPIRDGKPGLFQSCWKAGLDSIEESEIDFERDESARSDGGSSAGMALERLDTFLTKAVPSSRSSSSLQDSNTAATTPTATSLTPRSSGLRRSGRRPSKMSPAAASELDEALSTLYNVMMRGEPTSLSAADLAKARAVHEKLGRMLAMERRVSAEYDEITLDDSLCITPTTPRTMMDRRRSSEISDWNGSQYSFCTVDDNELYAGDMMVAPTLGGGGGGGPLQTVTETDENENDKSTRCSSDDQIEQTAQVTKPQVYKGSSSTQESSVSSRITMNLARCLFSCMPALWGRKEHTSHGDVARATSSAEPNENRATKSASPLVPGLVAAADKKHLLARIAVAVAKEPHRAELPAVLVHQALQSGISHKKIDTIVHVARTQALPKSNSVVDTTSATPTANDAPTLGTRTISTCDQNADGSSTNDTSLTLLAWYNKLGQPSRDRLHALVRQKSLPFSATDIDELPWNEEATKLELARFRRQRLMMQKQLNLHDRSI